MASFFLPGLLVPAVALLAAADCSNLALRWPTDLLLLLAAVACAMELACRSALLPACISFLSLHVNHVQHALYVTVTAVCIL